MDDLQSFLNIWWRRLKKKWDRPFMISSLSHKLFPVTRRVLYKIVDLVPEMQIKENKNKRLASTWHSEERYRFAPWKCASTRVLLISRSDRIISRGAPGSLSLLFWSCTQKHLGGEHHNQTEEMKKVVLELLWKEAPVFYEDDI